MKTKNFVLAAVACGLFFSTGAGRAQSLEGEEGMAPLPRLALSPEERSVLMGMIVGCSVATKYPEPQDMIQVNTCINDHLDGDPRMWNVPLLFPSHSVLPPLDPIQGPDDYMSNVDLRPAS
ncbi:hypothetical protein H0X32_01270 [Patescibacteria group bacterium]|nr:hypothetical protein [Patescibacteria group bacterium]